MQKNEHVALELGWTDITDTSRNNNKKVWDGEKSKDYGAINAILMEFGRELSIIYCFPSSLILKMLLSSYMYPC